MKAKEAIEAINNCSTLEELKAFESDMRKTVQAAYAEKVLELDADGEKKVDFSICIPYVSGPAQDNELLYAMRSIDKHMQGNYNVIVIGDKPKFELSDEVIFIPMEQKGRKVGDNYQKMQALIADERVAYVMLIMYDDTYLVNDVDIDWFAAPMSLGAMERRTDKHKKYAGFFNRTYDALAKLEKAKWNYSTHMPKMFIKGKLKELYEKFSMEDLSLIESFYYNYYMPDDYKPEITRGRDKKIGVYRKNANWKLFHKLLPGAIVVNNSEQGWSSQLSNWLKEYFSESCRFEK
jgi:hypothetical protein